MPFFPTRRRRVRTVLSAAVVLATLVACSATVDGTASRAMGTTTGGATTTTAGTGIIQPGPTVASSGSTPIQSTPVPAALETFYGQQLAWGPCQGFSIDESTKKLYAKSTFHCAYLTVPLDYSKPTGPTIKLGVLKVSASTAERIGSVVINPGGPGGSGVEYAGYWRRRHRRRRSATVRHRRVRPPRGRRVGAGHPLPDRRRTRRRPGRPGPDPHPRRPRSPRRTPATSRSRRAAPRCPAPSRASTARRSSPTSEPVDVAKDLDVLRAALGDQQLTYIGWSYGTSIGTEYAEQFPENVRAMILDGARRSQRRPGDAQTSPRPRDSSRRSRTSPRGAPSRPAACWAPTRPRRRPPTRRWSARCWTTRSRWPTAGARASTTRSPAPSGAVLEGLLAVPVGRRLLDLSKGNGAAMMGLADTYDGPRCAGALQQPAGRVRWRSAASTAPRIDAGNQATSTRTQYAEAAPFEDNGDPPAGGQGPCAFWPAQPTLDRTRAGRAGTAAGAGHLHHPRPRDAVPGRGQPGQGPRRAAADRRRHQPHRLPDVGSQVRRPTSATTT